MTFTIFDWENESLERNSLLDRTVVDEHYHPLCVLSEAKSNK